SILRRFLCHTFSATSRNPFPPKGIMRLIELGIIDINDVVSLEEYNGWSIGSRCVWRGDAATVCWIGKLKGYAAVYAGLAFVEAVGVGTGTFGGVELFCTYPNHAGGPFRSVSNVQSESSNLALR
ncbi:hypothetical protein PMAYCL1PPCAC_31138, partial [Pristionchus mayeri]